MKRYNWTALVQLFGLFGFAIIAHGQELLVTSPGTYTATGGCLSVEIKLCDPEHIDFKIEWTLKELKEIDNVQHTITRAWSQGFLYQPFPVIRDRWAFCMVSSNELWFCDGGKGFIYRKGTSTGIGPIGCPAPKLGERAPDTLKQWLSKKSPTNQ
jgi:hypothetical protein